jgi:uncharacterized protein (TIGR02996 family)
VTERDAFLRAVEKNPGDETVRLVFADWLDEHGDELTACVVRMQVRHGLPFATKPVRDVELKNLADDYDWGEVFGEGTGGNCSPKADACPPGAAIDLTPPRRADVVEVLAAINGENDGPDWIGLFRMNDGRIVVASGGCDYTGWD